MQKSQKIEKQAYVGTKILKMIIEAIVERKTVDQKLSL